MALNNSLDAKLLSTRPLFRDHPAFFVKHTRDKNTTKDKKIVRTRL